MYNRITHAINVLFLRATFLIWKNSLDIALFPLFYSISNCRGHFNVLSMNTGLYELLSFFFFALI